MRTFCLATMLLIAPTCWASAGATITQQEASDRVLADGFALVAKTEPALGSWNVWASKDGIAYVIKVDAQTGSVLRKISLADDD